MESLQEFISSKRNSNTWKHRPANSWNILVSESFSSFMSFKNLKLCTRQKLCRFLKFINLKLITYRFPEFLQLRASQTKAIQRVEKFIPTECWGCRTSPPPQFRKFKQWLCSFLMVETLYRSKFSSMKNFPKINRFGRLEMHTFRVEVSCDFPKSKKNFRTCHCLYRSKSETSER